MSSTKTTRARAQHLAFTEKAFNNLKPQSKRYNIFDQHTAGLGIAVQPSGALTFFHLAKVQGRPERTALGAWPKVSIDLARGKASELNGALSKWRLNGYEGASPLAKPAKAATLGDVLTHYIENHLKGSARNPERAIHSANWMFGKYLAAWRERRLSSIRREHVRELHKHIVENHGPVMANRVIFFLSILINHAIHPDVALWDGANPAAKPKKFLAPEESRTRVITREEAPRFFAALADEPHRGLRDFLLLALATGARKGTIFSMRWEQIDFDRALWAIPRPKGRKGKAAHPVPLIALALSVLKSRSPQATGYVFPGRKPDGHVTALAEPWALFLKRAEITGLKIHDLRRSLATMEGETGASAELIQKTIGHERSSAATRIYDRSERREDVREAIDAAVSQMLAQGRTSKRKLLTVAVDRG